MSLRSLFLGASNPESAGRWLRACRGKTLAVWIYTRRPGKGCFLQARRTFGSTPPHKSNRGRKERERSHRCNDYSMERSEEHTSELQSLMRISYAVFCLKKKK